MSLPLCFIVLHSMSNHLFLGKFLRHEDFTLGYVVFTSLKSFDINSVTFLAPVSVGRDGNNESMIL